VPCVAKRARFCYRLVIVDHEQVSGGGREFTAIAIYRVKDDKITAVWFLK
jgi:hypothetical protein